MHKDKCYFLNKIIFFLNLDKKNRKKEKTNRTNSNLQTPVTKRGRWPFLPRKAEAFASFSVFVLRTKAFAPSSRHFDRSEAVGLFYRAKRPFPPSFRPKRAISARSGEIPC
jgi:hypothetical protein